MLILRTLLFGPAHGHEITRHIQHITDEVLKLEHGSVYPALHRLERKGWVASKWDTLRHQKRECKYYEFTPAGRKQLVSAESKWDRLRLAIGRVMTAAARES
jgi:transcriptional regulator